MVLTTGNKQFALGPLRCNLLLANIIFAILSIIGQSGQLISLPLWVDTAERERINSSHFDNMTQDGNHTHFIMDSYFVLSFSSLCYFIFFFATTLIIKIFKPDEIGEAESQFPHKYLVIIGALNAANGILAVFPSSGARTLPYLQSILLNVSIPLIVLSRFIILRKKPTLKKAICTLVVMICLFVCLLPKIIPSLDNSNPTQSNPNAATGAAAVIWPIIFMLSFLPAALMNVYKEIGLKIKSANEKRVNTIWFFAWTSLYQLLIVLALFWLDFIPFFGNQPDIQAFGRSYGIAFACFFGGDGCSSSPGLRGTLYILFYILNYLGSGLLLRYAEGATLLAIVSSFVTPIGFIFWTLFREEPFMFHPHVSNATWFSIAGITVMFPAVIIYNLGKREIDLDNRNDDDSYDDFDKLSYEPI